MKVQRKVSPTTILEAEGQTVAEVFEALASLEEIFHGYEVCGDCGQALKDERGKDKPARTFYLTGAGRRSRQR